MFSDDMAEYGQLTFEKGYRSMNSSIAKEKEVHCSICFFPMRLRRSNYSVK